MGQRTGRLLEVFARAGHPVYIVDPKEKPSPRDTSSIQLVNSVRDTPGSHAILYVHAGTLKQLIDSYEKPLVVYDIIDDFSLYEFGDETPSKKRRVPPDDPQLIKRADVVMASSGSLADKHWVDRRDLIVVPNGVAVERFEEPTSRPRDLPTGRPLIGSLGLLSQWFNFELLEMVARRRPDWHFVLVGAIDPRVRARVDHLATLPNVLTLGDREDDLMPAYTQAIDLGAIWSVVNETTTRVTPLRMYEYLLAGKPCVATPLPACMAQRAVLTASRPESFIEAIEVGLAFRSPEDAQARRLEGRQAAWSVRLEPVLELLEAARRLTII